jgi:hypothetical protein
MLGKRHTYLTIDAEAIAAGISKMFQHMGWKSRTQVDVMTKFLAHKVSHPLVKHFLSGKDRLKMAPDFHILYFD